MSSLASTAMRLASHYLVVTDRGRTVEPGNMEQTLKVVLSALWNLSAHCRRNKADICEEPGCLVFLVELLRSSSVTIVENGGGILRNVSAYIAMADKGESYRCVLREEQCLSLLLEQLRSASMTVVSNAAGTLWNLSARSVTDQTTLINLGAIPILQSLSNSRHKSIATCAAAAIKNLHNGAILTSTHNKLFGEQAGLLTSRNARNLMENLQTKLSESVESDSDSGQSSEDESFTDSLSENVTRVSNEGPRNENKLPAHTNGNYLSRKPETYDAVHHSESPLDLRTKREHESQDDVMCHEMIVTGQSSAMTKLDTPPDLQEEKASFETKGEKTVASPPPFASSSSFDSDSTKSFQEEGSPMSVKSGNKEASDESDEDNDVSESLLKDLISSAMPVSNSNQDSNGPAPTPRSVWDSDNSHKTVIDNMNKQNNYIESLRSFSQDSCPSVNMSYQSSVTSNSDEWGSHNTSLQHCEELHDDDNMPVIDDVDVDNDNMVTYTVENSPFQWKNNDLDKDSREESNMTFSNYNINNNKMAPKKEGTFVVDEDEKIDDTFDINDTGLKLKNINAPATADVGVSPGEQILVKMRKSKSEHQLGAQSISNQDKNKKDYRRSWSKSPRSSRLIPGVVIKELKLKPKSECKTPTKEKSVEKLEATIKTEISSPKTTEIFNESYEMSTDVNTTVIANVMEKDLKMTSSVISNFDETISQIEEPSAMHDINTSVSLSSQAIRDIVKPADENVKQFTEMEVKKELDFSLNLESISHQLDSIRPPTLLDEMTMTSNTLVADRVPEPGATYVVEEEEANTVDDVTDVFDDESTLTPRGDDDVVDVPDLPLDSLQTTPTHSSSRTTPVTVRKLRKEDVFEKEKDDDTTSHLTYVIDDQDDTSGYRSITTDIVDVDERLNALVGEMYSWQIAEEDESLDLIQTEAKLMLETLTSSGLRSRSASVVSGEEESRCSSIGILRDTHIEKLELESELISGKPQSKIHNRDSFANKEYRPRVPPKPDMLGIIQSKFPSNERNKSYLIATKNPPIEAEAKTNKISGKNLAENKVEMQAKEKKSLKFSKLWKRTDDSKSTLEVKASKIAFSSKPVQSASSDNHKSLISKTFKNFGLKRNSVKSIGSEESNNVTPCKDKHLGTSIVLLSPNDAEIVEKLESSKTFPDPVETQVSYKYNNYTKGCSVNTNAVSDRQNLVPIINNPRNRFLQSDRQRNYNRKLDFKETVKNNKISASNKVTLV